MSKEPPESDYLQDLAEWQDKQYLPGYFVGGKLPLAIRYPSRKLGWLLLLVATPLLVITILSLIIDGLPTQIDASEVLAGGCLVFYLFAAIRLLTRDS